MKPTTTLSLPRWLCSYFILGLLVTGANAARGDDSKPAAPRLPAVFDKVAPENLEDLKAIEDQVEKVVKKVLPCTVGVRIAERQGSGVIVSKDGYVLTAGHVSIEAGQELTLVLSDGKTVKGKTLGANRGIDSGMIKIEGNREWPFAEMGKTSDLKPGQWCISCGHPGGYRIGRTPVVRLGRLLRVGNRTLVSDCTLVGGDSGGPLFDMEGKVIGIHSRIGDALVANVHVPVDTYRDTWGRLAKGDVWVDNEQPWLGVQGEPDRKDAVISDVLKGSPAEKAGLKPKDVIKKFNGDAVGDLDDLGERILKKKPGDEVTLEVQRGKEKLTLKVVLAKRRRS
jgi:serine protease Do